MSAIPKLPAFERKKNYPAALPQEEHDKLKIDIEIASLMGLVIENVHKFQLSNTRPLTAEKILSNNPLYHIYHEFKTGDTPLFSEKRIQFVKENKTVLKRNLLGIITALTEMAPAGIFDQYSQSLQSNPQVNNEKLKNKTHFDFKSLIRDIFVNETVALKWTTAVLNQHTKPSFTTAIDEILEKKLSDKKWKKKWKNASQENKDAFNKHLSELVSYVKFIHQFTEEHYANLENLIADDNYEQNILGENIFYAETIKQTKNLYEKTLSALQVQTQKIWNYNNVLKEKYPHSSDRNALIPLWNTLFKIHIDIKAIRREMNLEIFGQDIDSTSTVFFSAASDVANLRDVEDAASTVFCSAVSDTTNNANNKSDVANLQEVEDVEDVEDVDDNKSMFSFKTAFEG